MFKSCNTAFQHKTFAYEFGLDKKSCYLVCLNVKFYRFINTNHNKLRDSNFFAVTVLAAQKQGVLIEMLITILMICPRTTGGHALSLFCWLVKISKT